MEENFGVTAHGFCLTLRYKNPPDGAIPQTENTVSPTKKWCDLSYLLVRIRDPDPEPLGLRQEYDLMLRRELHATGPGV